MDIVDAHHHLWDLKAGKYPWLQGPPIKMAVGEYSDLRRDYLIEHFLADIAGHKIAASVHVQADWDEHGDPVEETAWLQRVADRHGYPHAIVAAADLAAPNVAEVLDRHCLHRAMRGIRMLRPGPSLPAGTPAAAMYDHPAFRRGFAMLSARGLSYDLRAFPREMDASVRLARDFPGTTIIVNHLGHVTPREPELHETWRKGMAELASCPNVAMKLSGFAIFDRGWTAVALRPWVSTLIELFGPERCMWGSNYPVDRLGGSYARIVEAMAILLGGCDPVERAAIMGGTARRLYRI